LLLLLTLLFTLTGCGLTPQAKAKGVAAQFVAAMDAHDSAGAEALLTDAARQRIGDAGNPTGRVFNNGGVMGGSGTTGADSASVVGDAVVNPDGETARVPFTKKGADGQPHDGAVLLRKTDDGWRVYAIEVAFGNGLPDLTINFEHPEEMMGQLGRIIGEGLGAAMRGASQGMGAMLNGMSQGYAAGFAGTATPLPAPTASATP
jgi:hypothetical protein